MGSLITSEMWGIYYKPDFHFGGIQGGAAPFIVEKNTDEIAIDPYGPESPEFIVGKDFAHMWVSALAHCQARFSGSLAVYKDEPSGGIGAFTPDSFPVFDTIGDNCYFIADSNHGYKMLGVGKLGSRRNLWRSTAPTAALPFLPLCGGKAASDFQQPFPVELTPPGTCVLHALILYSEDVLTLLVCYSSPAEADP